MSQIQINFYEDAITVPTPENFAKFKEVVAVKFYLDPVDVNELIINFSHGSNKMSVQNEVEYVKALAQYLLNRYDKKVVLKFELEVSEKSRLFQNELMNSRVNFLNKKEQEDKELAEKQEKLRQEILEK